MASEEPAQTSVDKARLRVPREELETKLIERIATGEQLADRNVYDQGNLDRTIEEFVGWQESNRTLLITRFTSGAVADEYVGRARSYAGVSLSVDVGALKQDISSDLRRLRSLVARLDLFKEVGGWRAVAAAVPPSMASEPSPAPAPETVIFIVHGHAREHRLDVQRFLEAVTPHKTVVLQEEADRGKTVIEKFEHHAAQTAYCVVLLTGDDEGRPRGTAALALRGRQNVVFEFGYFVGKLQRSRVALLHEPGVELPSDLAGLVYITLLPDGAWKMRLGQELRAAGIDVDMNRLR